MFSRALGWVTDANYAVMRGGTQRDEKPKREPFLKEEEEGEKPSKLETAREPLFSFMHSFILAVCYQMWIVAETIICHGWRIGRLFF